MQQNMKCHQWLYDCIHQLRLFLAISGGMHSMIYHVIFWQQQWSLTKAWYGVEMILPFWHCRDPWWRDQSPGCCKWKSLLLSPPAQRPGDFFLHCSQSLGGSDCGRNVHWFVQWRPWCQFPLVHQLYILRIYQTKKPTNNNQTNEKATTKTPTNNKTKGKLTIQKENPKDAIPSLDQLPSVLKHVKTN